jgi:hypothetical protein
MLNLLQITWIAIYFTIHLNQLDLGSLSKSSYTKAVQKIYNMLKACKSWYRPIKMSSMQS